MATHDYVLANASGAAFRADLNNALAAIVSNNSNATEPATTYAYMWWADTTSGQLKQRNAANDGWIVVREIDGTMLMEDGTVSNPGLAFADDLDTGLLRPGDNQLAIATNGVERVEFGTSEVVFNDGGEDIDFRIEGDTEENLVFVDAGNERIGLGGAPGTFVEINSEAPYVTIKNSTEEDTDGGRESKIIFEGEQSGGEISSLAEIEVSHEGTGDDEKGQVILKVNSGAEGASPSEALRVDSSRRLLVGTSTSVSTNSSLQIRNDSDGECLEVFRSSADANNPSISLTKTRGTAASPAEVSSGDILGALRFRGYDGASYQTAALVAGEADGSWTDGGDTTDNPGRLVFSTTADGASSPTPNMKLDSDGNLTVANNLSTTNFALINENGFFQANRATSANTCFEGKLSGTTTSLITAAGNAAFNGAVSKGSGSFKISHPLPVKTDTHYLYHSFVEGPQADLIYRGHVQLVNGTASVNIDEAARMTEGTFEALCTNVCCFTSNESDWTAVRGSVSGNILTIEAQDPASTADICWMVVGERKDQHMLDTDWTDANGRVITERLKSEVDSPVED